jgi:protein ImuA
MRSARANLIQNLRGQLWQFERSRGGPARIEQGISTGIAALDDLLPEGSLRPGTIMECLSAGDGTGAATLALTMARHLAGESGAILVLDSRSDFHPLVAVALGIESRRLIVVRPPMARDALWVLEQALRSPGVAVTLAWVDRLSSQAFRRLQLAAETGGGLGVLIRDAKVRRQPSWAEVRLIIEARPAPSHSQGRRVRIELSRARGGLTGGAVELEISDETGCVHLVTQLADPAALPDAIRA